ncbi:sulfatase family protein [Falsirhodobacter sp. 20TX0035]|uniref:sulfatase family protein n=1 Tax=Falsirhodobacter sp. 20TX0035 TaxID=3022019 RepID=UPI00232D4855|nr:sulfatase-like hydrolase/transferase [Falsirhodobacter sp. 20TX0035]MDB6454169.1 sulfatase-like hydrolase/transferase [Falsirhodobacter sp. 20TX0035]
MIQHKRPNIVFIITDQQRLDTIRALGYPHMDTPVLDRLVHEGTVFRNMYVTSPSCSPSRASLFSGTYPHTNGVFRNDEPWVWSWVGLLAEAGYRCVNVGKMHTMPVEGPFGFHERHVVENKDRDHPNLPFYLDNWDKAFWTRGIRKPSRVSYREREDYAESMGSFVWEAPEDLHPDVFVPGLACLWLERYKGTEPFFLQIGIPGPHPPYDPTQEFLTGYEGRDDLPMPITYDFDAEQPAPMRELRRHHHGEDHDAIVHLEHPTEAQLRRQRAHYYANVSMIDAQVGRIIDALKERGVLDNTIIVFTSDHGDCLNDHGHSQKWNMFEPTVHVPALAWGPGVPSGRSVEDLVALFDFGPTILEWAGIIPPAWMEARSLRPLMSDNRDEPARDRVFAEHANDAILQGTEFMTMIRKGNWKLVHFVDSVEGQLFDLSIDPEERTNLWDAPAQFGHKQDLLMDILRWRIESDRKTQAFRRELAGLSEKDT